MLLLVKTTDLASRWEEYRVHVCLLCPCGTGGAQAQAIERRHFVEQFVQKLYIVPMSLGTRANKSVGCTQASGTADTLRELGAEFGMDVAVMDLLGDDSNEDGNVSSSEVRPLLPASSSKMYFVMRPTGCVMDGGPDL